MLQLGRCTCMDCAAERGRAREWSSSWPGLSACSDWLPSSYRLTATRGSTSDARRGHRREWREWVGKGRDSQPKCACDGSRDSSRTTVPLDACEQVVLEDAGGLVDGEHDRGGRQHEREDHRLLHREHHLRSSSSRRRNPGSERRQRGRAGDAGEEDEGEEIILDFSTEKDARKSARQEEQCEGVRGSSAGRRHISV